MFAVYTILNKALVVDEDTARQDESISSQLGQFDANLDLESSRIREARLSAFSASMAPDNGVCRLPQLEYEGLHKDTLPVKSCRIKQNWGYIDRDTHEWRLNENARQAFTQTDCQLRRIIRVDDFKINLTEYTKLSEGDKIMHDVVEVKCSGVLKPQLKRVYKLSEKQIRFKTLFPQIIPELESNEEKTSKMNEKTCEPLNIILLSYDSVSRVSWINRAKKSYFYAMNEMKFDMLEGYNIVGDGTPAGTE
jgi:hypothetical protein